MSFLSRPCHIDQLLTSGGFCHGAHDGEEEGAGARVSAEAWEAAQLLSVGARELCAPLSANKALCHQRHLALCPGCVLGMITCPFKFWELSLTGAEVYLPPFISAPAQPQPLSLERARLGETPARMVNFHEKRTSWERGPFEVLRVGWK